MAHGHQKAPDIGVSQTERAEPVRKLRDPRAGELRHQHRDLERQRPDPRRVDIGLRVERAVLQERQQVHRGEIARRVVEEHVFRARIRAADRAVLRAGVPRVDRVVELHARIGAGPCRVADLLPEVARLDRLGHLAVGAPGQLPVAVRAHRLEEGVGHPDRVVRVLSGNREIRLGIPIRVVGAEVDAGEALRRVVEHALDVGLGHHRLLGGADRGLEGRVLLGIERVGLGAVPGPDRAEDLVEPRLVDLRPRDKRRDLLLLDDLPVDEILDVRVIHVADHHLGRPARRAARLDRAGRPIADLEEAHQPRGLAAAGEALVAGPQRREVRARARPVFEQPRLAGPQVHDPAVVDQIVLDRLDEAGMRLRMLVGAGRFRQLAALEIDVVMPLPRTVDAVGPVQAGVEPLRAVGRAHLRGQGVAHLVVIGPSVRLGREISALPAPIGPGAGEAVEDLPRRGLAAEPLRLGQLGELRVIGDRAPQEVGNALLPHALQGGRHARFAEILLRQHVGGHLAPAFRNLQVLQAEDHRPVRIADLRGGRPELQRPVGAGLFGRETAIDLHVSAPGLLVSCPYAARPPVPSVAARTTTRCCAIDPAHHY